MHAGLPPCSGEPENKQGGSPPPPNGSRMNVGWEQRSLQQLCSSTHLYPIVYSIHSESLFQGVHQHQAYFPACRDELDMVKLMKEEEYHYNLIMGRISQV